MWYRCFFSATGLKASVSLIENDVQGEFRLHTAKPGGLAGFAKIFELYGSLDMNGTVSGNIRKPSITFDFQGETIRFHGFPLDELHGRVKNPGGFTIRDMPFSPGLGVRVNTPIGLGRLYYGFTIDLLSVKIRTFPPWTIYAGSVTDSFPVLVMNPG